MVETPVAIVGAGLAGLQAARLLNSAGIGFLLVEARDRLGGRIHSVGEGAAPAEDGFDLGPSWFWPDMQPAMGALVRELGLASFGQHSQGDLMFERMARERPHRYRAPPHEPQSMRFVGGAAALVRAMAAALPQDRIRLGNRVAALSLDQDGVALGIDANGRSDIIHARQVIVAMPPRLLEATVAFTPAQEAATAARWRDTPTWMAPHAKFFALYDRPFWREAGLSGSAQSMVGPLGEIHDATTATGDAALFGFVGVAAEQRAAAGEALLTEACIDQLARLFGEEARHPRATMLKDWASDPFTATTADRIASGHIVPSRRPWVTGPWAERLSLGGSEASLSEPGYLAGSVSAAAHAVGEVLTRLRADVAHG